MQILDDKHLLMIEPAGEPTVPLIDDITRAAAGALRDAQPSLDLYKGVHNCTGKGCKAYSDNADWLIGGMTTNTLAVHYVACHRSEVPASELAKLLALGVVAAVPTELQLTGVWSSGGWL